MNIRAIKTRVFKEKENLISFLENYYIPKENEILVVTSKIVALSEGRIEIIKNIKTKEILIKRESQFAIRTPFAWLTVKDGQVMASAGIDESNANGKLILLPKDSFKQAQKIRKYFCKKYSLKNLGVIITDSRTVPLRAGTIGMALGWDGFNALKPYRGLPDIFGRIIKISRVNAADSLATSAVWTMGEGNEQRPLAVIKNSGVVFQNAINKKELFINIKEDLYGPLFKKLK